jgi:hypothetical protein
MKEGGFKALRHAAAVVEAPRLHLERARDRDSGSKNCLVRQLLEPGVPGQGVVVEGVKGVKYNPMPLQIYKNSKKTGGFTHFLAYKLQKMRFFAQKYLTSGRR